MILREFLNATLVILLIFLTSSVQSFAHITVQIHGRLKVSGNQIVGEHGNPIQLMGISHFKASAALLTDAPVSGNWDPEKHLSESGRFVRNHIFRINKSKYDRKKSNKSIK